VKPAPLMPRHVEGGDILAVVGLELVV